MEKFNRLKLLGEDFEKFNISYISEIMDSILKPPKWPC